MKRTRLHPIAVDAEVSACPSLASKSMLSGIAAPEFRADVLRGLRSRPKTLPCKYFYDKRGSELFDQICDLPEYYLTRTEIAVLRECLPEVAKMAGPQVQVIEYGSGSGLKTRLLLKALQDPTGCAMIEISPSYLGECSKELTAEFSELVVDPVCADYTKPFSLPAAPYRTKRKLAFFPGSTLGNFEPDQAREFLRLLAETVGAGGALLIGVDLQKDVSILTQAYDDAAGVTAEFNLNLLMRVNRELGGNFCLDDFRHVALWNGDAGRMEMHIVSRRNLAVKVAGETFRMVAGESIHTENSYKYTLDGFEALAWEAGWRLGKCWTDEKELFSVQYLTVRKFL